MNPYIEPQLPDDTASIENPAPLPPVTIMTRLRTETMAEHRAVEKAFNLKSAMENITGYKNLLLCLYGIQAPFEALLREMDFPVSMEGRWKTDWLYQDLRHLKVSQAAIEKSCKTKPALPPMETPAQILGSMYVLEGSTLGGQFIFKALQRKLPVSAEKGARFFAGYGQNTHEQWAEFGRAASTVAQSDEMQDRVIEAAKDMFVFMGKRLVRR
jgi:heme oxygenase